MARKLKKRDLDHTFRSQMQSKYEKLQEALDLRKYTEDRLYDIVVPALDKLEKAIKRYRGNKEALNCLYDDAYKVVHEAKVAMPIKETGLVFPVKP